MKPLVSVIIPAYNCASFIEETIGSVLLQTYPKYEIIVVDDGSTDNTKQTIAAIKDDRLRYYHQPNSGLPAKPRNKGIELSKGEYIAFLDHDDYWLPKKIEKQIAVFQEFNNIDLVFTNAFVIKDKKNMGLLVDKMKNCSFYELFINNYIGCSSVMVKREVFDKVGLFDENPQLMAVEDYDLWLRIAKQGRISCINEPLWHNRILSGSASANHVKMFKREAFMINRFMLDKMDDRRLVYLWKLKISGLSFKQAIELYNTNNNNWINEFCRAMFSFPFSVKWLMLFLWNIFNRVLSMNTKRGLLKI